MEASNQTGWAAELALFPRALSSLSMHTRPRTLVKDVKWPGGSVFRSVVNQPSPSPGDFRFKKVASFCAQRKVLTVPSQVLLLLLPTHPRGCLDICNAALLWAALVLHTSGSSTSMTVFMAFSTLRVNRDCLRRALVALLTAWHGAVGYRCAKIEIRDTWFHPFGCLDTCTTLTVCFRVSFALFLHPFQFSTPLHFQPKGLGLSDITA